MRTCAQKGGKRGEGERAYNKFFFLIWHQSQSCLTRSLTRERLGRSLSRGTLNSKTHPCAKEASFPSKCSHRTGCSGKLGTISTDYPPTPEITTSSNKKPNSRFMSSNSKRLNRNHKRNRSSKASWKSPRTTKSTLPKKKWTTRSKSSCNDQSRVCFAHMKKSIFSAPLPQYAVTLCPGDEWLLRGNRCAVIHIRVLWCIYTICGGAGRGVVSTLIFCCCFLFWLVNFWISSKFFAGWLVATMSARKERNQVLAMIMLFQTRSHV